MTDRTAREIAAGLREKRSRLGLTVRQVGEAAQVSFSTVARIERGNKPTARVEARLRAWLLDQPIPNTNAALEARVERLERQVASLLEQESPRHD